MVAASFEARILVYGETAETPFLFFIPAIALAAAFFDRGSGIVATLVAALLAVYYFVVPVRSFQIERTADLVNLLLFCCIGVFISLLIESLQNAYQSLETSLKQEEAARRLAEAGERERDMLMAELRHRIKNDLQRVAALMYVQAKHATPEAARALRQASERIHVIGRLHERLARKDGHMMVDVREFLHDLLADVRSTMADLRPVGLFSHADPVLLSVSRTGALGLIVNELVNNALKHAFPNDEREWAVRVALHCQGNDLLLSVDDNGCGIDPDFKPGTGSRLVRALVAQLDGHIETCRDPQGGTRHMLRFPVDEAHPESASDQPKAVHP
jgi:two-component sensor histidine kinase